MNPNLLSKVIDISTQEEADSLIKECIEEVRGLTCTAMVLSLEEADMISRKNLVATSVRLCPEKLSEMESFFQCKNPLI